MQLLMHRVLPDGDFVELVFAASLTSPLFVGREFEPEEFGLNLPGKLKIVRTSYGDGIVNAVARIQAVAAADEINRLVYLVATQTPNWAQLWDLLSDRFPIAEQRQAAFQELQKRHRDFMSSDQRRERIAAMLADEARAEKAAAASKAEEERAAVRIEQMRAISPQPTGSRKIDLDLD